MHAEKRPRVCSLALSHDYTTTTPRSVKIKGTEFFTRLSLVLKHDQKDTSNVYSNLRDMKIRDIQKLNFQIALMESSFDKITSSRGRPLEPPPRPPDHANYSTSDSQCKWLLRTSCIPSDDGTHVSRKYIGARAHALQEIREEELLEEGQTDREPDDECGVGMHRV